MLVVKMFPPARTWRSLLLGKDGCKMASKSQHPDASRAAGWAPGADTACWDMGKPEAPSVNVKG